jgi:hypothetical protein
MNRSRPTRRNETQCQKTTNVRVESRAQAKATPLGPTSVAFDLELDVKPRCCRIKRQKNCSDPCRQTSTCVFTVEVDLDFDAKISPCVQQTCIPVRLDVETEHDIQCESSPIESSCHPHLRKNCRCGNSYRC